MIELSFSNIEGVLDNAPSIAPELTEEQKQEIAKQVREAVKLEMSKSY